MAIAEGHGETFDRVLGQAAWGMIGAFPLEAEADYLQRLSGLYIAASKIYRNTNFTLWDGTPL